ncbi:TetR/AcrR family transcriptional regulator [Brachybacterium hainanense]|uniref:TetR/AcrR family transcriptional regulator n=1 Tax=Brachybacterium hainanense TaxID=1541174 RepID=A0ABV6RCJ4_9MICO
MMSRRGPYAKGEAKRQEILDVALEVVAEMGCRKASNREIARRVGLSQAGLMHYFGSREDLYVAVLRARDERDDAAFWLPQQDIRGFLAIMRHNSQVPGLVQLYVEFSAEASIGKHPAHGFFVERYAWLRERFIGFVRFAQEDGTFGAGVDAGQVADVMIAAADGIQQQWLLDRDLDMVARLELVWEGLAAVSRGAVPTV